MRKGKSIGVVIPALNEEQSIGKVIGDIPDWVDRVVVVDNGSTDGTADAARNSGATVLQEKEKGYGAACLKGMSALENMDILVFLDGDYSDHPDEMALLVDPIAQDDCDLVIGSRSRGALQPGALTLQQRVGNRLACVLMRVFWGTRYSDLGPFRAIDGQALRRLGMNDRNFGWTIEMQIKAALAGLQVREVPVRYRPRIGVSKISGTLKGTILAGIGILRVIGRFVLTNGITPLASRK